MLPALLVSAALVAQAPSSAAEKTQGQLMAEAVQAARNGSPLAPDAQAALDAFLSELNAVRRRHAAAGPSESVAGELARRIELDQKGRYAMLAMDGDGPQMDRARTLAEAELSAIDADNTAYLKRVLPSDGWFRNSRDGQRAARNAWLIVQHSPDRVFMKNVLRRMEPLARRREVNGEDYALLYDRMEMFEGRPQRFGSQLRCVDGRWDFHPIDNRSSVDARRKAMGFKETLDEYSKHFPTFGRPCGQSS